MNKLYKLFITFFLLSLVLSQSKTTAQTNPEDPRFNMTVKNIATTQPGNPARDSILRFEIWVQQTNQGQPGVNDFEYCAGQFTWTYNRAIQGNGNIFFGLAPAAFQVGGLPPALRPPSYSVDSVNGFLKMSGNLPNSLANFFISGTFPGTRIFTAQLRTTLNRFPQVPLNLRFKLGTSPNTFVAYFLPYPDSVDSEQFPSQFAVALIDTIQNIYSVENGGFVPPPPVILPPVVNFYANTTSIYPGTPINFTDSSLNYPSTWIWSFPGGTPSVSVIKNPAGIVYNTPGVYSVTLTAANNIGSDVLTKTDYITVNPFCNFTWKNTMQISDTGNVKDSLIFGTSPFGTDGIDSCHAERILPAVPPAGTFDVRFLQNNYACKIDFRKDSLEDKTWMMKFQPSASGYPITFNWDSSAFLSTGFFNLKDTVNGSIANVDMRNQKSFTLTNTGISSLKIEYDSRININLKVIPEGFYFPLFDLLSRRDTFSVYLRENIAPFVIRDSAKGVIDSITFSNVFSFSNTSAGNYYIVVKHLNSIETWSKPGGINISTNQITYEYDFTSERNQAYGNNLQLKSGKYCLYGGDVDQNGFIDLTDLIKIFNDSKNFITGSYIPEDLNGDSIVDLTDISQCYNNSVNFIRVRKP